MHANVSLCFGVLNQPHDANPRITNISNKGSSRDLLGMLPLGRTPACVPVGALVVLV